MLAPPPTLPSLFPVKDQSRWLLRLDLRSTFRVPCLRGSRLPGSVRLVITVQLPRPHIREETVGTDGNRKILEERPGQRSKP